MRGALFIPKYNFGLKIKIEAQMKPKIKIQPVQTYLKKENVELKQEASEGNQKNLKRL